MKKKSDENQDFFENKEKSFFFFSGKQKRLLSCTDSSRSHKINDVGKQYKLSSLKNNFSQNNKLYSLITNKNRSSRYSSTMNNFFSISLLI